MTAFDQIRRSRTRVMLAVNLGALLIVAAFGYLGANALRNYEGATAVSSSADVLPITPVGMFATVNDANALTSVALMVLRPGERVGGSIVSVPVNVDSSLGTGDTRTPLSEAYTAGGVDGLQFAVESALTISVDVAVVDTPAQALADLSSLGASADAVVATLTTLTEGQSARDRTAAIESAWRNLAAAVGEGLSSPPVATSPADTVAVLADITSRLFAGPIQTRSLLVTAVDPASNPINKDVVALDRSESMLVLAAIAPASISTPAPGMNFRLEAPAGYEAQVKLVVGYLIAVGANVKSVVLTAPSTSDSVLLIGDAKFRTQIESQGFEFGDLEMQVPASPILGIDVIMILGTDYLNGLQLDDPAYVNPTTTTTTIPGL